MARFCLFLSCFLALLLAGRSADAQITLDKLTDQSGPVLLDKMNTHLEISFDLPSDPGAASFILSARPASTSQTPGQVFLVVVNNGPSIPLTPALRGFAARFDIPASKLREGENQISVFLDTGKADSCQAATENGWLVSLAQSRIDIAKPAIANSLADLRSWLSADIGAPGSIAMDTSAIRADNIAEFGSLLTQAFSLRMNKVPLLVSNPQQADLIIKASISSQKPALSMGVQNGKPVLQLTATNQNELVNLARWIAENRLIDFSLTGPPSSWPSIPMHREMAPEEVLAETGLARFRIPSQVQSRLLMDVARPLANEPYIRLNVAADGAQLAAPVLWRRMNSVTVALPQRSTMQRQVSIHAEWADNQKSNGDCSSMIDSDTFSQLPQLQKRVKAQLQLAGTRHLSELDRLAWHGGRLSHNGGRNTRIFLPQHPQTAMHQSWRVLGRLAQLRGHAISRASYHGVISNSDEDVLYIGERSDLPQSITQYLPDGFDAGRGNIPGKPPKKYRPLQLIETAQADEPLANALKWSQGAGVAASGVTDSGARLIVLSSERQGELASALFDLAEGTALDTFSGNLVRWRKDLSEINAHHFNPAPAITSAMSSFWLILMLILLPTGIWSSLHLLLPARFTQS